MVYILACAFVCQSHPEISLATPLLHVLPSPDPNLIHVILSVDRAHLEGLVAVMHSLLQHASHPVGVVFHVVLAGVTMEEAHLYLQCYGLVGPEQVRSGNVVD